MNSLRTRLLVTFLAIALIPLIGMAAVTYTIFDTALRDEVLGNLRAVANAKMREIETYALERKRDVSALAQSPGLVDLLALLDQASITPSTQASASFAAREYVNYYLGEGEYTDLLLFSAEGRLLYSARQRELIGTLFQDEARAGSQLGIVFDRARTLLETEISDFAADPALGQETAYIAAPVLQDGIIQGVVALQIDSSALNRVITDAIGLDNTGETNVGRLVLDDGGVEQMILSAPLRLTDTTDILYRPVPPSTFPLLSQAARGARLEGQGTDYRGLDVVYVMRYLPSLRWGMVVKTDAAEAFAPNQNVLTLSVVLLAATLGAIVLVAVTIAGTVTRPILHLTDVVRTFEKGDLDARAQAITARTEVAELANGFNALASQLSGTINTLEDRVVERTQALEAQAVSLREARAAAETANQSKSIFLANMSHELRTPMNAILGFTQLIAREPTLDPRLQDYLGVVMQSGDHLLTLINDVLEMSRIEAGQTTVNAAPFDLYAMLKGVEDLFRLRAESKGIRLLIERDEAVPQFITTDESKLRQILINLVGNAIKFTHEGGIAVRVGVRDEKLVVEVEDTGDGISEADQQRLFQAFVQTETGVKSQQGTGLGLAITRQFVELLGGRISLRSQPGHGTVFFFDIAFERASGAAQSAAPRPRVIGIDDPTGKVWRVLVADDKWENRRLMIEWMKIAGFEVREVANGKEAVEAWLEWEPHLIWMDMRMPVMDGYEATRTIKSSTKGQATVIIALTASAFEHERAIVLSAGCDDFVRKPARESVIFQKMEEHLGVKFRYAETVAALPRAETAIDLTPAALAVLTVEQRAALLQAADEVDTDAADAVISTLRSDHPALAAALADLVQHYRFDHLQSLLDEPS